MNYKELRKQFETEKNYPAWNCNDTVIMEYIEWLEKQLKNCNLQNVNASTSIECTDGEHHFYEVYFVNSDKEPFELDCIKCLECGKIDTDI